MPSPATTASNEVVDLVSRSLMRNLSDEESSESSAGKQSCESRQHHSMHRLQRQSVDLTHYLSASGTGVQCQLGFDQGESLSRHRAQEVEPGCLQELDVFLQRALHAA